MPGLPRPLACLLLAALACSDPAAPGDGNGDGNGDPSPIDDVALAVEVVGSGYNNPLYLTAPSSDPRLFVVEKSGRIQIIEGGQQLQTAFLDISNFVSSGFERGLLSMAFHPDYANNGFFYVSYTDASGDSRIERYSVSGVPNRADAGSAKLILSVGQPFSNHNGGLIAFGPDGMLYIGLGDGGSGGDPLGNGQNINTLLGSLLRIDVDGGDPFAIPPDNPFVGRPGADEIWAYGLRNPWRFAFDLEENELYIADVGQNEWEEVSVVPADVGELNFGWNVMEGLHCFDASSCNMNGLELPALEYSHATGCSITGGYVYRGVAISAARGHYFYSDFCSGFLRSFRFANGSAGERRSWNVGDLGGVLSFGQDAAGELYILSDNGNVYRLIDTAGN